jgi:glycerol kinase
MEDTRERKRARTNEHLPTAAEVGQDEWFIGSIDQGTTSSRFLVFNREADPVASHQIEFENHYPESGYACTYSPNDSPSSC